MIWIKKLKEWLKFQWPDVNDCRKCNGTGVIYTKCECQKAIPFDGSSDFVNIKKGI